jgi:hypothetical protein
MPGLCYSEFVISNLFNSVTRPANGIAHLGTKPIRPFNM